MTPAEELTVAADKLDAWSLSVTDDDVRRFWSRVALPGEGGCMLWLGGRTSKGYGAFRIAGANRSTHRISLILTAGTAPSGKPQAAHSCRNRHCVAPSHLRWASAHENERDKVRDGTVAAGERHGATRLTRRQVRDIKARYAMGGVTHASLGAEYDVSAASIGFILSGKRWIGARLIVGGES